MKPAFRYSAILLCGLLLAAALPLRAQSGLATDTTTYYSDTTLAVPSDNEAPAYTLPRDRNISEATWQQLTADSAFYYRNSTETEETLPEEQASNFWSRLFRLIFAFLGSGIGQFLFWGLILAILAYVLYRIFKGELGFVFGRREAPALAAQETEDITEEDLLSANWAEKTRQAVGHGDTVLATRYTFLYLLQLLQQLQLIQYRMDKTNYDYDTELEAGALKDKYRALLLRYEYAWFGRFPVSAADWQQTNALFNELRSLLGK